MFDRSVVTGNRVKPLTLVEKNNEDCAVRGCRRPITALVYGALDDWYTCFWHGRMLLTRIAKARLTGIPRLPPPPTTGRSGR